MNIKLKEAYTINCKNKIKCKGFVLLVNYITQISVYLLV